MFIEIQKPANMGSLKPNANNEITVRVNSLPINSNMVFTLGIEYKEEGAWKTAALNKIYYMKDGAKIPQPLDEPFRVVSATGTYILDVAIPNSKIISEIRTVVNDYSSSGLKPICYSHPNLVSSSDTLEFTLTEPSLSNSLVTRVKVILDMDVNIPEAISMEVYGCNNPLDTNPVWEDITAAVISGSYAQLNNRVVNKGHGINLKFKLTKHNYDANCKVNSVNFVFY